ncbi:MAG: PP2C family protein-serine/threonine phosphatase [Magnetovibrionaceae bacterium]
MPRTLVIDDDPGLERMIKDHPPSCADGRHDFVFARTNDAAVDVLLHDKTLDVAMVAVDNPELAGLDIFRRLGDVKVRIPRIALMSRTDLGTIRAAMNGGAADFLAKPIRRDDLDSTINRVFADCEARRHAWRTEAQLAALEREVDVARNLQSQILPGSFEAPEGIEIFARMEPAKAMSGDFFDLFEIDDNRFGFVIADVSGKGVPAAFFMAVARTLIRATALTGVSPGECLDRANLLLCHHQVSGMFVSVFYGVVDRDTWELTYANGGHNTPFVIDGKTQLVRPLVGGDGVVLGVQDMLPYEEGAIILHPGDSLFLYTDGVSEAFNKDREQFSEQRLMDRLGDQGVSPVDQAVEAIFAAVAEHTAGAAQSDDMTAVMVRRSANALSSFVI